MKAYLTAFNDQLSGYVDIPDGIGSILYLPFLDKTHFLADPIPYKPPLRARFDVYEFVQYKDQPGLTNRIPHYKFVGLE
jgi:hypothetical protein